MNFATSSTNKIDTKLVIANLKLNVDNKVKSNSLTFKMNI